MKIRLLVPFVLLISVAVAQTDPPGRVARLNLATGAVSMLSQSTGPDWVPAQINYPLTTGDQVWTDVDGHAELHLGTATVRLREETSATFALLDDQTVQLQLIAGGLNIRVGNLYDHEVFEIDTPNVAFTISRPGDYRIDVNGQQTKVIVWSGAGEISGDNRTFPLRARDYATVSGSGQLGYTLLNAPAPDDFDRWAQDRDRRQQQSQSARYVAPNTIGYEDLDLYGSWSEVPNLGSVWTPRVNGGWAPYKAGHWAWIEPWGWTWIDDAPWGFAPFHYGRWAYSTGAWVWVPGPPAQRVVYSPALVAWCGSGGGGGGGGFRVSASIGAGLAWFALGPGEVYVPSHRASAEYVTRVNVTNTVVNRTVVNNVYNTTIVNKSVVNNITYVNQNAPGAVVGMSHSDMAAGRRGNVTVASASIQPGQVTAVAPVPVARPLIQSSPRAGNAPVARPPAAVATPSRPMVMRNQVPAAAARPTFTSATGAPAPERPAQIRPLVSQPQLDRPQPAQPQPLDQGRRFPGRDSETVRPTPSPRPVERPQVQTPPVQQTTPTPPVRQENPERIRRQPPVENPTVPAPQPRPAERVERPAIAPPDRRPPERVERPAITPPERRPAERVERQTERVERPINVQPPAPQRREGRPEPKHEEKKEEKKDDKKDEKKQ